MKSCCDTYCANHGCNQGRECPARATPVARIGRKDYAREELPPSVWPRHLRILCKWMLVVIMFLLYAALMAAVIR